uniref:EMB3013 n=1 Tax=Solanum tuberosum TaxID=4113 RepID=M1CUK2_SOLTU
MNQYHICEAIGHGKHSTVYKGRKKKTIEYFVILSVDKSQKNKVLHEVRNPMKKGSLFLYLNFNCNLSLRFNSYRVY